MRIISTSSVKTNEGLYNLMRIAGLYMLATCEEEPTKSIDALLAAMQKIKPIIKPMGIPATDANSFNRQIKFWQSGGLDWDNTSHSRRFETSTESFFLYLQEVFFDLDVEELTEDQKSLRSAFDEQELVALKGMLGYILALSRRYTTTKFVNDVLRACSQLFSEDRELYWKYTKEEDTIAEEGYEKPADYDEQIKQLTAILSRNGVPTCDGDPLLATFEGLKKFATSNPQDYERYGKIRTFLSREAFKAVIGNIVFDNMGQPQKWSTVYNQLSRSSTKVYIPHNKMPNDQWSGIIQVVKNAKGDDCIQYLSPYGEPLKQSPCGNVIMNPKYTEGSTEFVAQYIIPSSQAMTKVYVYTQAATSAKNAIRFNQTRNVIQNLDMYRSKWMKDLKAFDTQMEKFYAAILKPRSKAKLPTPEQWKNGILAMICEIGYQAAPRTGEKGSSSLDSNGTRTPTYALTTLKIGHLILDPVECHPARWGSKEDDGEYSYPSSRIKSVSFKYKGKAAEPQYHEFSSATPTTDGDVMAHKLLNQILTKYIANLARAYADMGTYALSETEIKRQQLFRIPNVRSNSEAPVNEWSIVLNRHVNEYLKKRIKFDGTFKMFRKLKATKEFMDYMDSVKGTMTAEDIDSHILHAAGLAGKALGHAAAKRKATGTMALQYYIEVNTILEYYKLLNVNPTKRVANLIKDNITDSKV